MSGLRNVELEIPNDFISLLTGIVLSFEALAEFYRTTRRHIPEQSSVIFTIAGTSNPKYVTLVYRDFRVLNLVIVNL